MSASVHYLLRVIARATQHSLMQTWQHQRICTLCLCHISTISLGLTLCKLSFCTSCYHRKSQKFRCHLADLPLCRCAKPAKNSLSTGQQDDRCKLICRRYAHSRPADVPVSGALPGYLSANRPETVYLTGSCSSIHIGEASTFLTAFSVRCFLARSRSSGVQALHARDLTCRRGSMLRERVFDAPAGTSV